MTWIDRLRTWIDKFGSLLQSPGSRAGARTSVRYDYLERHT